MDYDDWKLATPPHYEDGLPSEDELAAALRDERDHLEHLNGDVDEDDEPVTVDVRLQLIPGEGWALLVGDASFDTDHRGYWSYGFLAADATDAEARSLAAELLEENREAQRS